MKKLLTVTSILLGACCAFAQTDIFTCVHTENFDGLYNAGRVVTTTTIDGTVLGQWGNGGTNGTVDDGRVWHAFSRYKMYQRDLFNKINDAGQITWTTGCIGKQLNREDDPINGGHDVDVYLVVDPAGDIIPSGQEPKFETAFDWANELGQGYEHTAYVGRIPQSVSVAAPEDFDPDDPQGRTLLLGSPSMNIVFDITDQLKQWIADGILTSQSTIALGTVQRRAVISDGNGGVRLDDPELYVHSIMGYDNATAFLTTGPAVGPEKGPFPFDDYDLVDGYVDTGSWMSWVYVVQAPWAYQVDLSKWIYVGDKSGWVYIPK